MEPLALLMYIEIDIMCLTLLGYIGFKSFDGYKHQRSWVYFQWSILFVIFTAGSDLVWILMENHVLPAVQPGPYIVNAVYFVSSVGIGVTWFFYTETELNTGWMAKSWVRWLVVLPVVAEACLLLTNYHTGWLFYFDSNAKYIRGAFTWTVFVIPNLYIATSSAHAAWLGLRKENYIYRKSYLSMAAVSLYTMGACLLQFLLPGSPLPCVGISIALFMSYTSTREQQVSVDPLTHLNNRYQIVQYLGSKLEHRHPGADLFLLLIDLDKFKSVNDTYGHVEGDRVLIRVARVLDQVATKKHSCFAARYAGDEFVLICEGDERLVHSILEDIDSVLAASNTKANAGYDVQVSVGWAKCTPDVRYVPDLLDKADQALYQVKTGKKCKD